MKYFALLIFAQTIGGTGWWNWLVEKLDNMALTLTDLVSAVAARDQTQEAFLAKVVAHNASLQARLETTLNKIADLQGTKDDMQKQIDALTAQTEQGTRNLKAFAEQQWQETL